MVFTLGEGAVFFGSEGIEGMIQGEVLLSMNHLFEESPITVCTFTLYYIAHPPTYLYYFYILGVLIICM